MGFDGGSAQEVYIVGWDIVFRALQKVLIKMNLSFTGIEYELKKVNPRDLSLHNEEIYPGIQFSDRKVNFFAQENALLSKGKVIYINIFQNQSGVTLVNINRADPSLMYGWQVLMANPGYERLAGRILSKLSKEL